MVPENVDFIIADVNEPLDFPDGSIDLVQSRYSPNYKVLMHRLLLSGIRKDQWSSYMDEIFRICKPGDGWAQVIEPSAYLYCDDGTVPETADNNTVSHLLFR